MMKINILMRYNVLALIGLMGVVAILSSCEDDQRYGGRKGETMQVAMTISTEFSGVESRAVFDSSVELEINNVTRCLLLIYNGTGNNATLEYVEEILDPTKFPLTRFIPTPAEGVSYRAIMLGNVLAEQLGDAAIPGAQLEDLNDYAYEINSGYNDPAANANITNFTWSSYPLDYTSETSTLGFTLNPNVAKVKVSITDNSTKSNIVKVQVKNVPNKVRFAQNALSKGGNFVDGTVEMTYIDYNIEELDLSDKKGKLQTLYWYLPHNQAGTGNRNTNPIDAPDNATWVEFDGMRTSDFLYSDYKIYPGEDEAGVTSYNNLKNFNIKADYQYRLNVNITDKGVTFNTTTKINETAAGVAVEKVKLPYNSNCYMIHPLGSRTASGTLYELPINRINEYWGATYGVNDASMQIGDNTEWEAYVIWQDIPQRAIYFADKDGNVNKTSTVYSGTGMTPIYFKLVNQNATSATQTYGNVLIGVRNKSTQTTLWSWHLWITDYNPDVASPYSVAKNNIQTQTASKMCKLYSIETLIDLQDAKAIGNVQHYKQIHSYYWGVNWSSDEIWDNGIYADKWIMDRNLGSQTAANYNATPPSLGYGMYYQYGRKDPFPFSAYKVNGSTNKSTPADGRKIYNINGTQTYWNFKPVSTGVSIKESVQNPAVFYGHTTTQTGDWCNQSTTNLWNHPKSIAEGQKSVFDPCPPGWCLPVFDAFEFLTFNPSYSGFSSGSYIEDSSTWSTLKPTLCTFVAGETNSKNFVEMVSLGYNVHSDYNIYRLWTIFPLQGCLTYYDYTQYGNALSNLNKNFIWLASPGKDTGYGCSLFMIPHLTGSTWDQTLSISRTQTSRVIDDSWVKYDATFTKYSGRMSHDQYGRARGHNVRCIQANGDTPKFYDETE